MLKFMLVFHSQGLRFTKNKSEQIGFLGTIYIILFCWFHIFPSLPMCFQQFHCLPTVFMNFPVCFMIASISSLDVESSVAFYVI